MQALLRRGQAYEDSDKPHEAFKDFEKALEIDPGLKEAKIAVMVRYFFKVKIFKREETNIIDFLLTGRDLNSHLATLVSNSPRQVTS